MDLPLVLASASPRRAQALLELGLEFNQLDPGPDGPSISENPEERVLGHARFKVASAEKMLQHKPALVLGGDTLVWNQGRFFPKPTNLDEAKEMLQSLMGKEHQVWTSHVLKITGGLCFEKTDCARVQFQEIPPNALDEYLSTDEWTDKAGGYGIQGWAGKWAQIKEGDLDTVIGFRKETVLMLLEKAITCLRAGRR
ncbi:MAG: nucleoside triphosphate pyrophosphatase [Planctomycetota bacterium]|jgi:septum formation protein|nr:nucleoside triphosphate pyrophosphatase [Planctomycetota bacterium]